MGTSRSLLIRILLLPSFCLCLFFLFKTATARVTDTKEGNALIAITEKWGRNASWWEGDPCFGEPVFAIADDMMIQCECHKRNRGGDICYITQLYVYGLNVTGPIPQELQFLEHLERLDLPYNYLAGPVPAFFGNFTNLQHLDLSNNYLTGPVPAFFGNLTNLLDLDLSQNYLTGPLPASFGNLSNLQHLSLNINALSGRIPKELGNLKNIEYLDLSINNFGGSIPPELGGMISLQYWYMDSSGLSGDLPSQLSHLFNLNTLWASDNNFTGKLPGFLGSLTSLTKMNLQGNSFEGPIPNSFSNLVNMTDLRIGDITITTGSSTLQFISNMTFLETLILRNCKISGILPSNFSQYSSLQELDLSFNDITGPIPESLFGLSKLETILLGNNSLSGSLPAQKISVSLTNVDVSYNQLSGSFPYWVGEPNLQLNLVANNFVFNDSSSSSLPAVLKCLQNDRPCYRDSPIYHSFAVNCGGNRNIKASDEINYEIDSANLTSVPYYGTDQIKWAVSSVGSFVDWFGSTVSSNYTLNGQWQFQKTSDFELFQTSRLSPSSLRYYGLGLENGNYTIKLQFAETQILNEHTWESLGRRIFDIYIQGDLKEKDFDIRKEAGGTSFTAVEKEYTAPVTSNFLEIHFFWAGKGTCCVPYDGYYGPSISAISVSPKDFTPTTTNKPPTNHQGLAVGLSVGAVSIALIILCLILLRIWRKKVSKEDHNRGNSEILLHGIVGKPERFSYAEMRIATDDFSSSNLLGEGGYGPVFKGKLSNGRIVAVKQLSVTSHQGKHQFMAEIETISVVQHCNLVKLLGYCVEGDTHILVYEFLENKSLDQAIFGNSKLRLDWPKRFEICLGVAKGLAYLHEESPIRIVHRDVKASNILLDADMKPKISDFGLAKLYDEKKTHVSTKVAGTIGYLAPEYAMKGHLTKKADVYAFGVLSLEILAGRPNSDHNLEAGKIYLLEWAWYLHENKLEVELVDRRLPSFDKDEVDRVIGVALLCTQASPAQRPSMSRVVAMLAGDIEVPKVTMKPIYLDLQNYQDDNSSYAPDNTSTKYSSSAGTRATVMSSPSAADSLLNSFIEGGR